jgi:hypothetical protein
LPIAPLLFSTQRRCNLLFDFRELGEARLAHSRIVAALDHFPQLMRLIEQCVE